MKAVGFVPFSAARQRKSMRSAVRVSAEAMRRQKYECSIPTGNIAEIIAAENARGLV